MATETLTAYSFALGSYASGSTAANIRLLLTKALFQGFGGKIRLNIKGHNTTTKTLSGCSIGPRSGSTYNFASAPTRVTFGGNNSVSQTAGATITSDWITFDMNPTRDYLVHLAYVTDNYAIAYATAPTGNGRAYKLSGGDETLTESISGYTTDGVVASLLSVEVETTGVSKRRWRINVTANDGHASYVSLSELKMMVGGVDQCSGGYPRASTIYTNYSPYKAFDGDSTTAWAANSTTGWIEYELPSAVDIDSYSITARVTTGFDQSPTAWKLQYWDGLAWVDVDTITGVPTHWRSGMSLRFTVGSTLPNHWGVYLYSGGWYVESAEIEMMNTVGGSDQCTGGTSSVVISTSTDPSTVFDDNNSTYWASQFAEGADTLVYNFPSIINVVQYAVTSRDTHSGYEPSLVKLRKFDDKSTPAAWVDVDTRTGLTWGLSERKLWTLGKGWKVCGVLNPAKVSGVALPAKGAGV